MTLAVALLAGAAVLVWPGARSAHLVWPRDETSASPGADRTGTGLPGWRRTGSRGWLAWRRRRRAADDSVDLLALVEAVLPALQAGLAPGAALGLAADATANGRPSGPTAALAHHLAALSAQGLPIGPLWAQAATAWQSRELRLLAQAWSLTEDLGAPLAEAVLTTAGLLRARLRAERRVAGAVAGARATMNVLTALPLGGPFLALALGVGPSELYGSSPLTGGCLAAGGVLVLAGRSWVARMVRAVTRGPVLS